MKRYKSSDLTNKRAEVIEEARVNGVIIEVRKTNGDIMDELVLKRTERYSECSHCKGNQMYFRSPYAYGDLHSIPTACPMCGGDPSLDKELK